MQVRYKKYQFQQNVNIDKKRNNIPIKFCRPAIKMNTEYSQLKNKTVSTTS